MKKIYFLVLALGLFTGVNAQIINIPDANFKATLLASYSGNTTAKNLSGSYFAVDANHDGEIQINEAANVSMLQINNIGISDLTGIQSFINIKQLYCHNNELSTLNLSGLSHLENLYCIYNQLTILNLTGLTSLRDLYCDGNQFTTLNLNGLANLRSLNCSGNSLLTSLNLSGLTNLEYLGCGYTALTSLNASGLSHLITIECSGSSQLQSINVSNSLNLETVNCFDNQQLTSLDIHNSNAIKVLNCYNNQLNALDVSSLVNLQAFRCDNNHITTLDLSSNIAHLQYLYCDNNNLTSLFLKNGVDNIFSFQINDNPNLQYVCADEVEMPTILNLIDSYGYTNCVVNSYCSFTPGGTFYTIQGQQKFDDENNGCDASDNFLQNFKYTITNGSSTGTIISNNTGSYSIPVQAGTHILTPVFENPTYFTISPAGSTVTFPTQASPFTQNFCITPNGTHNDLEVVLLPIIAAVPGFDATYKLIYKNKGTSAQSGSVNLVFNDLVMDLVSANPIAITQTVNNLSWDFTNLLPFETREISITLNVNSPLETPAVNDGDILNYTTSITSVATDELPSDNAFTFNQTVVNSLDPNDKTCLEGVTIAPSEVGKYVHYMIRFENTGTANAQNIVVRDLIDTDKFDVNSLIPINGSHSFTTKIAETNRVEFIFQNINLPFDDANNDGYIAFKIKTKPTLVVGNTFSNTASIYFDYNFPIVTNTATTTIAALSRQDFEFSNYFNLYPNPVNNILNISAKETIEISSINIYNMLGQLVLVIPNAKEIKAVDVSNLTSGNYFIKINSDKGTANTKFIKN